MKKCLLYILMTIALLSLCSCFSNNRFIPTKTLKNNHLTDFIKPTYTTTFKQGENTLNSNSTYFNSNLNEFRQYGEELYTFLKTKDYRYFGYWKNIIESFFGATPTYSVYQSSNIDEHIIESHNQLEYQFVLGNKLDSQNYIVDYTVIRLIFSIDENKQNKFNTCLLMSKKSRTWTKFVLIPQSVKCTNLIDAYEKGKINHQQLLTIAENVNQNQIQQIENIAHDIAVEEYYVTHILK